MDSVEILKASAGSGKTYNLALSYIRLLLESNDRYAYRHILAVTFTNKATEEMKSRILKELHTLAKTPDESPYLNDLMKIGKFKGVSEISAHAQTVLCNILHDYGSFAVSTIDGFFQRTLKAFSRELGQFASYKVELDKKSLIDESTDRILDSLSETDTDMLDYLTSNAIEQLENGKGYSFERVLKDLAQSLKSERFRIAAQKYQVDIATDYNDASIEAFSKACTQQVSQFENKVRNLSLIIEKAFLDQGLQLKDTNRGCFSHIYKYIEGKNHFPYLSDSMLKNAPDTDKWFAATKSKKMLPLVISVKPEVDDLLEIFEKEYPIYSTARLLMDQVLGFSVAARLYSEFDAILREKNVLSIDDSNTILKDIIDGTDTPFVYEKLGVKYEHFLLDEFQDTSNVQWENFRPLLKNSIDSGFYSLIVGDVKQSIYRWRDSDWELFDSEVEKCFHKDSITHRSLKENYRSCKNIVDFNNSFFAFAAQKLDENLKAKGIPEVITGIYKDVHQNKACKIASDGYLQFSFLPKKSSQEEQVLQSVRNALQAGFAYGDIAVLVRTNDQGASISKHLIDNGIPVVTTDALRIAASVTVQRLVSLLTSINNPQDKVASFFIKSLDIQVPESYHSLVDLCEEFIRALKLRYPDVFQAEVVYVQSFMDLLGEFVQKEGNTLDGFLSFWKSDESSVSSAPDQDSVNVMTIHKSKGLDFPYVILPYMHKSDLFSQVKKWVHPDADGTVLQNVAKGVYNINLSSTSDLTLFASEYRKELMMQYVDKINMYYVAATRASQGLHFISEFPDDSTFADILYQYVTLKEDEGQIQKMQNEDDSTEDAPLHWTIGTLACVREKPKGTIANTLGCSYDSYPLNPVLEYLDEEGNLIDVREVGRLKFSTDSVDFFNEDGAVGIDASRRLRGVVLHDVLARVLVPADLHSAVEDMVSEGLLPQEEADAVESHLKSAIDSVSGRGWFPADAPHILREAEIIDTDGTVHRPDRVVLTRDKAIVIDYKFGEHRTKYERQVARYADLFRRMGYAEVETALWYVDSGEIRA